MTTVMRALRRVRLPEQTSACLGCGRVITERRRRPCRTCGSINRAVSVQAGDRIHMADKT